MMNLSNKMMIPVLVLPILAQIFSACAATLKSQTKAASHEHHVGPAAQPAVHGMVLFGKDSLYASHIPMFMQPHDWQALLKVQLSHPRGDMLAYYKKLNIAKTEQVLYTLKPEPFVLPDLLEGKIKSFQASLYQGNFEDGGKLLLSGIKVNVEDILEKSHLDPQAEPQDSLSYLSIQQGENSYLAHKILAPDSFDQLVEITWLKPVEKQKLLLQKSPDLTSHKLQAGHFYKLSDEAVLSEVPDAVDASFQVKSEFYCTLGPDFFQACD